MTALTSTRIVLSLQEGQLTIPAEFRRRLGIDDDTLLQLILHEDKIEIVPMVTAPAAARGWAKDIYEMFAPVRAEAQTMDEAEIDSLIDEAIDCVG